MSVKKLKSVDISSYTIISTGINTLISILISLIFVVGISITVPDSFGVIIYVAPTIIFGTIIYSIFLYFSEGYLYNLLSKFMGCIELDIEDGYIRKISPRETAFIVAAATLILLLVIYLALILILPLLLNAFISILMYASQMVLAYMLYQYIFILSNPVNIGLGLIAITIFVMVFTLISTYCYNLLGSSERGVSLKLSTQDKFTAVDSIDYKSFAIAVATISLILNLILGIILIILGSPAFNILASVLISFFISFIAALIIAAFYNFLAPRIGKLNVELE